MNAWWAPDAWRFHEYNVYVSEVLAVLETRAWNACSDTENADINPLYRQPFCYLKLDCTGDFYANMHKNRA